MDVDASVNDLLSDAKEHGNGKQHEVDESVGDFLKTVRMDFLNDQLGEENLPKKKHTNSF